MLHLINLFLNTRWWDWDSHFLYRLFSKTLPKYPTLLSAAGAICGVVMGLVFPIVRDWDATGRRAESISDHASNTSVYQFGVKRDSTPSWREEQRK